MYIVVIYLKIEIEKGTLFNIIPIQSLRNLSTVIYFIFTIQ